MAMAPRFWKWIAKSFSYEAERRNGALVALDFDNRERWRRNFFGALIKEVTFPTLDGSAKDPAYLTIKFVVENLKTTAARRATSTLPSKSPKGEWEKQRLWLPSMFTFKVDSLTGDNQETVKVESFSVKQEVIDVPVGGKLLTTKEPGRVDFPQSGGHHPAATPIRG